MPIPFAGKSTWVDMMNPMGNQMNPDIMSQMAQQASVQSQDISGGVPPMLAPQPNAMSPAVVPVPTPRQSMFTAQPTRTPSGEPPSELISSQPSTMGNMGSGGQPPMQTSKEARLAQQLRSHQVMGQADIDSLKEGLAKYAGSDRGLDFTPLAALSDTLFGGNLAAAARATAPETSSQKMQNLQEMRMKIAAMQGKMSEADIQQASYEEQRASQERIARTMAGVKQSAQNEQIDAREEARREKQTIDYSEQVAKPAQELESNVANLEAGLGFKLDSIDPNTGFVNGKEVDLPGFSVPLVGRVNLTEKAADLQSRFAPIFNIVLKTRSGGAVTTGEAFRLQEEFGRGKFNTESQLLAASRRFRDAAAKQLASEESGYVEDVKSRYKEQGGNTVKDLFSPSGGAPTNVLTTDKLKRLEELRTKLGK